MGASRTRYWDVTRCGWAEAPRDAAAPPAEPGAATPAGQRTGEDVEMPAQRPADEPSLGTTAPA